jgi:hypothetical protein
MKFQRTWEHLEPSGRIAKTLCSTSKREMFSTFDSTLPEVVGGGRGSNKGRIKVTVRARRLLFLGPVAAFLH